MIYVINTNTHIYIHIHTHIVTWHETFWLRPILTRVLEACRIECTFSLDSVVNLPFLTLNGNTRSVNYA